MVQMRYEVFCNLLFWLGDESSLKVNITLPKLLMPVSVSHYHNEKHTIRS